jgi:hypothetical protein
MVAKIITKDGKSTLVIEIAMETPRDSASGKTFVVASTSGFVATTAVVNGKPVAISLNATIRK